MYKRPIMIVVAASIVMFTLGVGTQLNMNIFGPQNYEDCVIENIKGVDKYAIREIKEACRAKFPIVSKRDLLPDSIAVPSSVLKKISVKGEEIPSDGSGDFFDDILGNFKGKIHNGDSAWTLTALTLRLTDSSSNSFMNYRTEVIIKPLDTENYSINILEIPERYNISVIAAEGFRK